MSLQGLKQKWQTNSKGYKQHEIGDGVHDFVSEMFSSSDLFRLTKVATVDKKTQAFTHDTVQKDKGRPDFVLHTNKDVTIPVEAKCYGKIEEGVSQILRYQLDYSKQYGILTDGNEWRFYRAGQYNRFFLSDIYEKTNDFLIFWNDYIKPEHYYIEIFNREEKENLFFKQIDLNDAENRKIFFDNTTKLISNFRVKLKIAGTGKMTEKQEVETVYSYLIQFVLFKVIVDNGFKNFTEWYKNIYKLISKYLLDKQNYQSIVSNIKMIADYVSSHIYKPFALEQENINRKLFNNLKTELTIDDISAWLDIIIFIDKYNFGNLKNEIFGFIYENYLKDLYDDKNKGQYFTDPEVVNLMLEEMGYTPEELGKDKNKISIIDPSCGAGTFLYSAVDAILRCFPEQLTENEALKVQQLIIKNIFGLDIEEFPLYLAEMNILMRLLPMIISDNYENPINDKIKIFKTKDSISEFLDAGIGAVNPEIDYPSLFSNTSLGYEMFMRDDKNLQEMIESMQGHNGERMRFDFVVGNPPYVGLNECYKPVIWARNQFNAIGSDNKNEIFYIFSLLNSKVNLYILHKKLKSENEKNFTLAIKSIKQCIRIPNIISENQKIKDEIIVQTEKMLDIEKVTLQDLVDFKNLMIQRFDNIEVKDSNLILTFNKKDYSCKINKGKEDFVKKLILEKYFDNSLIFNRDFVTLQELKNTEAIDFEKQTALKNYIDDLVFALYFSVELPNVNLEYAQEIEQLCNKKKKISIF